MRSTFRRRRPLAFVISLLLWAGSCAGPDEKRWLSYDRQSSLLRRGTDNFASATFPRSRRHVPYPYSYPCDASKTRVDTTTFLTDGRAWATLEVVFDPPLQPGGTFAATLSHDVDGSAELWSVDLVNGTPAPQGRMTVSLGNRAQRPEYRWRSDESPIGGSWLLTPLRDGVGATLALHAESAVRRWNTKIDCGYSD